MNDEYIALDCASSLCRETGIEARLRKIKRSRRKGVNTNMSAFIVEDKTINRIVNMLVHEISYNPESYNLKEKLSELGYDLSSNSFAENLAKDMFDLNVNAVRQRYSGKEEAPKFTYSQGIPVSFIQSFKSLSC